MSITGDRIKKRRKELGMSLQDVADALGVNKSTILRYESNEIEKLPINVITPLAEALNVSREYLMGWESAQVKLPEHEMVRTIPVYGDLSCGNGLFVDDAIVDSVSVPLSMLPNRSAEYFAQYASGDSMINAGINDGDLVIFEKTSVVDNGQIGCFCVDENIATCKKFSKIGGKVYLLPANDRYSPIPIEPENECFRIIGKKVLLISKGAK